MRSGSIQATFTGIRDAGPYTATCVVSDKDAQAVSKLSTLNNSISVVDTGSVEVVEVLTTNSSDSGDGNQGRYSIDM